MSRSNPALQKNISTAADGDWFPTGGFIHSVDAALETGATSASVDIYVSNSSHGTGVKLASLSLFAGQTSDGLSIPKEDSGWAFVRSKVVAVVGSVKSVTACVGE